MLLLLKHLPTVHNHLANIFDKPIQKRKIINTYTIEFLIFAINHTCHAVSTTRDRSCESLLNKRAISADNNSKTSVFLMKKQII